MSSTLILVLQIGALFFAACAGYQIAALKFEKPVESSENGGEQ